MPARKQMPPNAKQQAPEEISLDAIRRIRENRMQEIRASVSEGPGAITRSRYCYRSPFWNKVSLALFRR